MVKNAKTGLGRALVKHHNQMVQLSKEKGYFYYNQGKKVLESVTEVNDIEAVIEQAEEAERLYSADHPVPNLLINLDGATDMTHEEWRELQMKEEALHASSLRVPRRPPWTAGMSVEELDDSEKQAFLVWRRSLARLEENEKLVLTPFEKNLDIWRQLWRVLERSDLLVMVVDARDPLFYRCPDLEAYAQEIDKNKKTLLLVNKADLLPFSVREKWVKYFHDHGILFLFWSAKAAFTSLDGKKLSVLGDEQNTSCSEDIDTKIYSRDELLTRLQAEAEAIAAIRKGTSYNDASPPHDGLTADNVTPKHVVVGFVGYPNVGKSSTINALVGEKRTGVTSTPGKTKHFQTLIISDKLMLCDCPGLVFPSFTSSRYDMIASGVLPIDRMTEHREAVQVVANRVPRHIMEEVYNIRLPMPKPYESQSRPPLASELLMSFCYSRGHFASSGLPDETRAARQILKDYIDGKLPHFEMPPVMTAGTDKEVTLTNFDLDPSDAKDDQTAENTNSAGVDRLLQDLDSFDITDGSGITNAAPAVKKPKAASHKQHKKPQRKKDRSWRVGRDADEVMQHVRAFQKPVNIGPVKSE